MNATDVTLSRLASRQHGLVSRAQARALGLSPRQLDVRTSAGLLVSVHRGVYRLAGSSVSPDQSLLAACLAAGTTSMASHRSAAALWCLRGADRPPVVEVTVPGAARHRLAGVVVHRSAQLPSCDVTRRSAVPVTTPARTLLDLGAVAPQLVEAAMEDALLRSLVSLSSLRRVLERSGAQGRAGTAVLRRLVDERDPSLAPTESPLEDALLGLLRRHGLPEPVRQHPVALPGGRLVRLDFAYPDLKLGIEADGRIWHSGRADFQRDRERGNLLARLGWTVLRFGSDDLRRRGDRVAVEVSRLRLDLGRRAG